METEKTQSDYLEKQLSKVRAEAIKEIDALRAALKTSQELTKACKEKSESLEKELAKERMAVLMATQIIASKDDMLSEAAIRVAQLEIRLSIHDEWVADANTEICALQEEIRQLREINQTV